MYMCGRRQAVFGVLVVVFAVGWPGGRAVAIEAGKEKLGQSVVLIKDALGAQSGVVVGTNGLILTERTFTLPELDLKVSGGAIEKGAMVQRTFDEVELQGVQHPTPFALLRVDSKGVRMLPATTRGGTKPEPGMDILVAERVMQEDGTTGVVFYEGMIGTTQHMVDHQPMIQIDVPFTPKLRGAPVADRSGRVIAIIAGRFQKGSWSVPIELYELKKMIKPAQLLQQPQTAHQEVAQALRWYDMAELKSSLHEQADQREDAKWRVRQSVGEASQDPQTHLLVARGFWDRGLADPAAAFLERVEALDPRSSAPFALKGLLALAKGEASSAEGAWQSGLRIEDDQDIARARCAWELARLRESDQRWAEAAYLAAWSIKLNPHFDNPHPRRNLLHRADAHLSDAQQRMLLSSRDFNLAGLQRFAQMPETKPAEPDTAQARRHAAVEQAIKETSLVTREGLEVELPGQPIEALPAYSGLYVAVRYLEPNRIDIISLHTGKTALEITPQEMGAVFACGGDKLVLFYPKLQLLETWDLSALKLKDATRTKIEGPVSHLIMGLENGHRAVVAGQASLQRGMTNRLLLLDLETGRPLGDPLQGSSGLYDCKLGTHFRSNLDLTRITQFRSNVSPLGVGFITTSDYGMDATQRHQTRGSLGIAADRAIYTGGGWIMDFDRSEEQPNDSYHQLYPVIDSEDFYIQYRPDPEQAGAHQIRCLTAGTGSEVMAISAPYRLVRNDLDAHRMFYDRTYLALARTNRLMLLHPAQQKLRLYPLGLGGDARPKPGTAHDAAPGQTWQRKLSLEPGQVAELVDGPAGLTLVSDPEPMLAWDVPADADVRTHEILILIKQADGGSDYRREFVAVKP